jgi:hypothetical protein
MGKIALAILIFSISACARLEGTRDRLAEYGYGTLSWIPEEDVCVAMFTDKDANTESMYMADRIKSNCDQIPGENYFEIYLLDEKDAHLEAIKAFKDWIRRKREIDRVRENELAECIVTDRSTIIYGSSTYIAEDGTLVGANLNLRSSKCPTSVAEMELAPDGSFDIHIAPFVYPID